MTFQICAICNQQEDVDFIFTLTDNQDFCECCAIDAGEHKPQGLILNPEPPVLAEPLALDFDEISDLY